MSGGGKGKTPTIGYRYYLGMHMGLCHGPVDFISRIDVDKRTAWEGNVFYENGDNLIEVDAVKLFGGDKREGGVSGNVDVLWGGPEQQPNAYLTSVLGDQMPAFRGVFSVVLNKCYLGNNPYLKPWSFYAQRIHVKDDGEPQWYDEKAPIGQLVGDSLAVYFVLDHSGSMETGVPGGGTRLSNLRLAMNGVLDHIKELIQFGAIRRIDIMIVGFSLQDYDVPTGKIKIRNVTSSDINTLKNWVNTTPDGTQFYRTLFTAGFHDAEEFFTSPNKDPRAQAISIFITDGRPNGPGILDDNDRAQNASEARGLLNSAFDEFSGYVGPAPNFYGFNIDLQDTTYTAYLDNRPPDETIPVISGENYQALEDAIIALLRGRVDMNPAHIIRECLTSNVWGMGYQDADIDDDSFQAAADTLYLEAMGISILWNKQVPIEDFIAEILSHIDATLYVDRITGRFVLKLIRDDYSVSALTVLDESNIVEVSNSTRPTIGELTNSISVVYWDASTGEDGSVSIQDQALIQVQGVEINTTRNYPGFTNYNIASRVALRDLKSISSPLLRCEITANRDADVLNIGDPFLFDWPDHNVTSLVMRVNSIEYGDTRDNAIKITAVEDVFSISSAPQFEDSEDPGWTDPVALEVLPSIPRIAQELPYFGLVRELGEVGANNLLSDDPDAGFVMAVGGRQDREMLAFAYFDSGAGYGDSYYMDFCGYAHVSEPAWFSDSQIYYSSSKDLDRVTTGTIAQIESELVRVDGFGEDSTGTYVTVGRGVLDTTPNQHSAGEKILFWQDFEASDEVQYAASDEVDVKLSTVNGVSTLDLNDAPTDSVILASRAVRPYPPGDIRINGFSYPAGGGTPFVFGDEITWKHRDRLQQTDGNLYDYSEGDIGPESGTTYIVRADSILFGGAVSSEWLEADVGSSTSYALDSNTDSNINAVPANTEYIRFKVYSVRDGYESWQPATILVRYEIDSNYDEDEMTLIETITNASAGEFDFASIPQNFNRLVIKGYLRSSASGTQDTVYGFINTSTTVSSYLSQRFSAFDDGPSANLTEYAEPRVGIASGDGSPSGYYHNVSMEIEGYAVTKQQIVKCESSGARDASSADVLFYSCLSPVSAAVTRLRIRTDNHPTDGLIGTLRLYGEY